MQCSVVIPCHGGAALTGACIDSLVQQDDPPAEILVVDNASPDDTATLHGRHGIVRVLAQGRNLGFAGGVNAGIRAAQGRTILILNNDTLAAPNLLREMHAVLESDPRIAAVAPVSNHVKGPAMLAIGARGKETTARVALAAELAQEPARVQDTDTLAGLCLLVRKTTFAAVGLFDERFGHGNFEDDDFCLRLRLLGHRLVIARRAFLHHEGHATFRALGLDLGTEIEKRFAQFAAKWALDPAGRATIAALRGDVAGAAAAAREARIAWPGWPDADFHLARHCTARGFHAGTVRHLTTLLHGNPRHSDAAVELACALLATGDRAAAERHLATTVRHCHLGTQHERRLLVAIGEHSWRNGDHAAAARDFAAALQLAPDDGALHNWLGLCHLARADLAAATTAFTAAIAAGFALAHTNLGITLHRQGLAARARDCFAKAVELLPHDRVARDNLAAAERLVPAS
jgi:GT2 family glycosyltransferase